jgi:hypothetical protein
MYFLPYITKLNNFINNSLGVVDKFLEELKKHENDDTWYSWFFLGNKLSNLVHHK